MTQLQGLASAFWSQEEDRRHKVLPESSSRVCYQEAQLSSTTLNFNETLDRILLAFVIRMQKVESHGSPLGSNIAYFRVRSYCEASELNMSSGPASG